MRVTHRSPDGDLTPVHGPGDLSGRSTGSVVLSGDWTPADAAFWAIALGLFAARGGSITWRKK